MSRFNFMRRSNPATDAAENARQAPVNTSKKAILRTLASVPPDFAAQFLSKPDAPVSAPAIRHLILIAHRTSDSDWLQNQPLNWEPQTRLASYVTGKSTRTIRRHEHCLAEAGLIRRATAGNGHRDGRERTGIDLSPLIERAHEIEAMRAIWVNMTERHRAAVGEAKRLRGSIVRSAPYAVKWVMERIERLRYHAVIWPRRVAYLSLTELDRHIAFLRRLTQWMTTMSLTDTGSMSPDMSGRADNSDRPITDEYPYESCNCAETGASGTAGSEQGTEAQMERQHMEDEEPALPVTTALPVAGPKTACQITPRTIRAAATPTMRAYIAGHEDAIRKTNCPESQHILNGIAEARAFDLGIDRWLIERTKQHLTPSQFFTAVLVLDSNRHHPNPAYRTRSPGALLWSFLRRAADGTLNLTGALAGIVKRVENGHQSLGGQ